MFHSYCCLYLVHWLPTPLTLFGCFFALRVFFCQKFITSPISHGLVCLIAWWGQGLLTRLIKKKPISRWHVLSDYIMLLTRLTCSWLPHAFNSDNMVPSFHYVFEKKNHFLVVFPWCFFEPMPGSLHGLLRRNPVAGRGKRVSKGILSMIHQPKYLSPKRSAAHERGTTAF